MNYITNVSVYTFSLQNDSYVISSCVENPVYIENTLSYNQGGTFKVVAQNTPSNREAFNKECVMLFENGIVGISEYIDKAYQQNLTVKGRLGNNLLSRRALFSQMSFEDVHVGKVISDIYNELTPISNMTLQVSETLGDEITRDIEPGNFLDILEDLCSEFNLGYRVTGSVSTNGVLQLTLAIYEGTNRSDSVVMSIEQGSVSDFEYSCNSKSEVNFVKILGEDNYSVDVYTGVIPPSGLSRKETVYDCSSVQKGDMTDPEYEEVLRNRGKKVLQSYASSETYQGQITNEVYTLNVDYFLGDKVRVYSQENQISTVQIISEVLYQYDFSGTYTKLTFGQPQPNLPSVLSQLTKKTEVSYTERPVIVENSGGSSGVGEWLDADHTIENFNIYEDVDSWIFKNTSNNSYDHLEGFSNTADGNSTGANHLEGAHNTLHGGYYNHIEGQSNTVYSGIVYSAVGGGSNTVGETNGSWQYAIDVKGYHNTVKGSDNTAVRGSYNTVNNSPNSFAAGNSNTLNNASYSMCSGMSNQLSAMYAFAVGNWNRVSANGGAAIGNGNTVNAPESLAVGHGATTSGANVIAVGNGQSGNAITLDYDGTVTARVYNTSSADYAEYFEWADGNIKNEDRMGFLVEIVGDKIAPAQGTNFIGAISARASVIGNAYENHWHGKYMTDVFGRMMFDDDGNPLINPEFDENQVYIPRSQRPEWDVVGLLGCIIVCDNGHCEPGCHVSARRGIACPTYSVTRALCLRRINKNHIEVLIR